MDALVPYGRVGGGHIEAGSAAGEDNGGGSVVAMDDQRFKGLRRGGTKRSRGADGGVISGY